MPDELESESSKANADMARTWSNTAAMWNRFASPARPAPEDIGFCIKALRQWSQKSCSPPRVLVLGVTPEFYHISWPEGTDILAVDNNPNMIHGVWPGTLEQTLCADWLEMDLAESSRDIAYLDGGLTQLSYPEQQRRLSQKLHHIVAPRGIVIFRLITPPRQRESLGSIVDMARNGKITNVQAFVLRLMMAMQYNACEGMTKRSLSKAVQMIAPDINQLCEALSTPNNQNRIDPSTHGPQATFHFVSLQQVVDLYCGEVGGFKVLEVSYPSYEMGELCPTLILECCK